ncbi:hypothetical protein Glove_176g57 [Diversispora epigaea]|uniref:Uncharacterized protein n=1 Tax=Diversispora epigaea TaxID=1348612 RepID=A0A397ITE5_9GLOM|nr:hypothetical protein Glove_176g57 [Diversispora epigaea]
MKTFPQKDNIKEFPSSTRAELMAILTCLQLTFIQIAGAKVLELNKKNEIDVDLYLRKVNGGNAVIVKGQTKNVIDLPKMKTFPQKDNIKEFPSSTRAELMAILTCLQLTFIQIAVKAHSGDKFNEIADELAVIPKSLCKFYNDIFEGTTISLNYKNIKNRNFIPMWKSSLLEIPIKQAIKEIYKVKTMIDWKFQERFKYFTNSEKNKIVNI